MKASLWILLRPLILLAFGLVSLGISPVLAQDSSLRILVRDSMGTPLPNVAVSLYHNGPPHEFIESRSTDASGMAEFSTGPGSYLVAFTEDWQGASFLPASDQNAGTSTDGELGGFAIYADPTTPNWLFTFVITQSGDGTLIPLWDTSRDSSVPPQPFTFEGVLDPETGQSAAAGIPDALPTPLNNPGQTVPTLTETPVEASSLMEPQASATQPAASPTESAGRPMPTLLIVGLILSGSLLVVLMLAIRQRNIRRS